MKTIGQDYDLEWKESIRRWDEAIPLGSGGCGCLCWGTPNELRFSLDRTDIWDHTQIWQKPQDFTYQRLTELARKGEEERIREIFDAPYNYLTPTKLPAGKLLLRFSDESASGNVSSRLSLLDACAHLRVRTDKICCEIRTWIHAIHQIGVVQIFAPPEHFSAVLQTPDFGDVHAADTDIPKERRQISKGSLQELKYPPARYGAKERGNCRLEWFCQPVTEDFSYGIALARREDAGGVTLLWKILSSKDGEDWLERGKEELLVFAVSETLCFEEHKKWWETYFSQSKVFLPDFLAQKHWYLANYLFAAASRKGYPPMPLQGVWTADDGLLPPWKGDYHNDLNTEFCYSHYLKANHLQEGESFLDFLWGLRDQGRCFAREFYGTDGICLPGVMTISGEALGGWPMYSLSPTCQIWLARSFEQHYRYTADREFLRQRAYPYLAETGVCISELLEERDDGMLCLPVSSSPEIHDDTAQAWIEPVSNYDLALLRYLFSSLERLAEELGLQEAKEWRKILDRLPQFAVDKDRALLLSANERLEESHRHLSNAMAIVPLELLRYEDEDRKIIDATIAQYERLGTRQWVGFTFPWMSRLYTIQKNGDKAWEMLRIFWENFCGPNGFHLNGDYKQKGYSDFTYRPFTLEGNFAAADALQEMLFQMEGGNITLFPALPRQWEQAGTGFETLRGEHGLLCSARFEPTGNIHFIIDLTQAQFVEEEWYITVTYGSRKESRTMKPKEIWEGQL